jgi:hypothetical protein
VCMASGRDGIIPSGYGKGVIAMHLNCVTGISHPIWVTQHGDVAMAHDRASGTQLHLKSGSHVHCMWVCRTKNTATAQVCEGGPGKCYMWELHQRAMMTPRAACAWLPSEPRLVV